MQLLQVLRGNIGNGYSRCTVPMNDFFAACTLLSRTGDGDVAALDGEAGAAGGGEADRLACGELGFGVGTDDPELILGL